MAKKLDAQRIEHTRRKQLPRNPREEEKQRIRDTIAKNRRGERKVTVIMPEKKFTLGTMLHPSPASPVANKFWPARPKEQIEQILAEAGIAL